MKLFWVLAVSVSAMGQTNVHVSTLGKNITWNKSECKLIRSGSGASLLQVYLGKHEQGNRNRLELRIPGHIVAETIEEMKGVNVLSFEKEFVTNHKDEGNVSLLVQTSAEGPLKTYSIPEELGDASCKIKLDFSSPKNVNVTAKCQKLPPAIAPSSQDRIDFEISQDTPVRCALD